MTNWHAWVGNVDVDLAAQAARRGRLIRSPGLFGDTARDFCTSPRRTCRSVKARLTPDGEQYRPTTTLNLRSVLALVETEMAAVYLGSIVRVDRTRSVALELAQSGSRVWINGRAVEPDGLVLEPGFHAVAVAGLVACRHHGSKWSSPRASAIVMTLKIAHANWLAEVARRAEELRWIAFAR